MGRVVVDWMQRVGIALGWLGLTSTPATDAERVARIDELYASYRADFPGVPEVAAGDRAEAWVLVDTRTPVEREVSTLPDAVLAEQVEAEPAAWRGRKLVAYCTIGYRSGQWAQRMREQGLDVANLQGGILAWTHAGGELVGPDGAPTRRVHVYGPPWDLAATAFEAIY